jgi:carbamoyltransferase
LSHAELKLFDHHEAHASAAAWAAPSAPVAIVTIDGVGDGLSSTISAFRDGRLQRVAASSARSSLGVFFEHVTSLLNMRELEDEGKVMALADYASPIADEDNPLVSWIQVRDGVLETAAGHSSRKRAEHSGIPNRQFAYLAQRVVERTCAALARDAAVPTASNASRWQAASCNIRAARASVSAGGGDVYVFHIGDGGLALGAGVAAAAAAGIVDIHLDRLDLGPEYATRAIAAALDPPGSRPPLEQLTSHVASMLRKPHRVVVSGWMGDPRALGHRASGAADRLDLRDRLNLVLKRRVCSAILPEHPRERSARARGLVQPVEPCDDDGVKGGSCFRSRLAGVVSIDGTCRPELVSDDDPGEFAAVLREARSRWGVGAVLNTSFNIHGEPMVCTPAEAIDVFRRSGADALAIGPFLVERTDARTDATSRR